MSILDKIAQVKPITWDNTPLPPRKNYVLITLGIHSDEYDDVLNILQRNCKSTLSIRKIKRVQHPFAYGSFLLRKKQLELKYGGIEPKDVFVQLNKSKLADALEYNLDRRRIFGDFYYISNSGDCLIIAKCLRSNYGDIERDSEIYPDYVVYYER